MTWISFEEQKPPLGKTVAFWPEGDNPTHWILTPEPQLPEKRPCPFCLQLGSSVRGDDPWWIACDTCNACGPDGESVEVAIQMWNTAPRGVPYREFDIKVEAADLSNDAGVAAAVNMGGLGAALNDAMVETDEATYTYKNDCELTEEKP